MNLNINFKQGFRRIAAVGIALFILYFSIKFIFSGFIFWKIDYIGKATVINLKTKQEQSLIDFSQNYFEKEKSQYAYLTYDFNTLGFDIHPYKGYFKNFDNIVFKNNEIYSVDSVNYQIKLPGELKYLYTQIWQFLLIPLGAAILAFLYLLIEKFSILMFQIICWVIKGFKN